MTKSGAVLYNETGAVAYRRLATSLRREVMRMGNGGGARALRFAVVFLAVLGLLVYISPNVC